MAEAAAKSMLGEISQGHLECPICFCRYKDPKILDCLHSFCLTCLDGMLSKQQPNTNKITCPVCRKETPVPDAGLPGLLDCFFLSSLVDEFNKQERSLETQKQVTSLTCDGCEEGLEAVSRCLDCEENLCQLCKMAHQRYKRTKTHRVTQVEHHQQQQQQQEQQDHQQQQHPPQVSSADLAKKYSPKCQKHNNQEMHFYCETCKLLICGICAAIDHRSAEHKFSELADAVSSYRKEVNNILQGFQKSKEEYKVSEESVDHARSRLKVMVTRACSDIDTTEEKDIAKIKSKAHILRDQVTESAKRREEEFERVHTNNQKKMERAEKIEAAVTNVMKGGDNFELLNLKPKVMQNLEFQKDLQFERVKHGQSFIGVKCQDVVCDKDLGVLLHEEKWKLKNEFGKKGDGDEEFNWARSVGCFSNGDIAVHDIENKRVSVFTSTGQHKTKTDLNAKLGISVASDLLWANYKNHVKHFDKNLQLNSMFNLSQTTEGAEPCIYTSSPIVANEHFAVVADGQRGVTSLYNLDGTLIRDIISPAICQEDIAVSNTDRIIFTNFNSRTLRCLEKTGKEVFTVRTNDDDEQSKPAGVCCDDAGDIYVTLQCGENGGNSKVHRYDSEGVFVGCVAEGLLWPFGIALSPSGELVVADQNSVKIFHQV